MRLWPRPSEPPKWAIKEEQNKNTSPSHYLSFFAIYIFLYWGGGSVVSVFRGSGGQGTRASVILVLRECIWKAAPWVVLHVGWSWMYLECARGLACPPSLWRYRLLGFSSASGGLSPCLKGSTLGDCLPFPWIGRLS